jgi:transcription elongation factor Elf1
MSVTRKTTPTLLVHPTTACPRCDGERIVALALDTERSFAWYECAECNHLWAIPRGWTPHAESRPSSPTERRAR